MTAISWALAARPKTLSAALVPVLVATALAYRLSGSVNWEISLYALLVAIFIQIGTNLVNDALDFKRGADTEERLGPVRVTQSGLLRMEQVLAAGMMCFGVAFLFSLPLMYAGGWPFSVIILLSVLCGYMYTGGPAPLAYVGLGDLFVLIFFGYVATGAVYYLQTNKLGFFPFIAGTQVGLLSMLMIAVNNLRDVVGDRMAFKRTLPVRFGVAFGRLQITGLIVGAFLLNAVWLWKGFWLAGVLPLITLPLGLIVARGIWTHKPGRIYNRYLGYSALMHVTFGILLAVGLLMG